MEKMSVDDKLAMIESRKAALASRKAQLDEREKKLEAKKSKLTDKQQPQGKLAMIEARKANLKKKVKAPGFSSSSSSSESSPDDEHEPGMATAAMVHDAKEAYRKERKMIRKQIKHSMKDHSQKVLQSLVKKELKKKSRETSGSSTEEAKDSEKTPGQQTAEAIYHKFMADGKTQVLDEQAMGRRPFKHGMHPGMRFRGPHGPQGKMFKDGSPTRQVHAMKNKMAYFMRQMFADKGMCKKLPLADPGNLVPRRHLSQAIPVNHPTKTFVAFPGEELMVELTFRNGNMRPYGKDCHLESSFDEASQAFFAPVKISLPETASNETFTVKVPVKILETADTYDQESTLFVGVTNWKGKEVGYAVPITVKLVEKMDETALYDKAMQLMAKNGMTFDQEGNFEKAIQALKEAGYNVDKAAVNLVADTLTAEEKKE